MKKRYIFAIPHEKADYIMDARNPYTWEECGAVVLPMDATEKDVMQAREKASIPFVAYCVACEMVEA